MELTLQRLEELEKVAKAATPGPWEQDCTVKSDGTYGSGEDANEGYDTYEVFQTLTGKKIFDFLNSEVVCVEEEYDEDGRTAWDAEASANAAFIAAANPATILSLLDHIKRMQEALERARKAWLDYADLRGTPHQEEYVDGSRTYELVVIAWAELDASLKATSTIAPAQGKGG
jgi:hypothetical protein